MKHPVIAAHTVQDAVQVAAVRIRDENLAKAVARHELHNLLHAPGVQLVEEVVQQEQRHRARRALQEVELRQLQRHQIRLVLSLRAFLLDREIAQQHVQFVLMDAPQGIAHDAVPLAALAQDVQQRPPGGVRFIRQPHLLPVLRNERIERLEDGDELADEGLALAIDHLARLRHHLFPDQKQLLLHGLFALQQNIALCQGFVIADEGIQIFLVILRDDHIHEAPATVAAPGYQFDIGRRHHHQGDEADMVRQAAVLLLVALELLLLPALHAAIDFLRRTVRRLIEPLYHEEIGLVKDVLRVDGVARALTERQVVDGIQQIGLAHAVLPEKAVQLGRERQFHLLQVLIIKDRYTLQYHNIISQRKQSINTGADKQRHLRPRAEISPPPDGEYCTHGRRYPPAQRPESHPPRKSSKNFVVFRPASEKRCPQISLIVIKQLILRVEIKNIE